MSIDQANGIIHPTSTTEVGRTDKDMKTNVTEEATHMISCKEEAKTMPKILSNEVRPPAEVRNRNLDNI